VSAYLVRRAAVSVVIALGLFMAIFGMPHVLYRSPVLLAYTLVAGLLTIAGHLVADIALTVTDPRIRLA